MNTFFGSSWLLPSEAMSGRLFQFGAPDRFLNCELVKALTDHGANPEGSTNQGLRQEAAQQGSVIRRGVG
jgi:hypothetical protein